MTVEWVRLWHDMPTDPKWRVIARKSLQPIALVLATFNFILVNASANATERGRTHNLHAEDIAAALDVLEEDIKSILSAMQGKVINDDLLMGWEKRQPKREDSSAERAKAWRERNRTQTNANELPDSDAEEDKKETPLIPLRSKPTRRKLNPISFDEDQTMPEEFRRVVLKFPKLHPQETWESCRDWHLKAGRETKSVGASANTWCKKAMKILAETELKNGVKGNPRLIGEEYRGLT